MNTHPLHTHAHVTNIFSTLQSYIVCRSFYTHMQSDDDDHGGKGVSKKQFMAVGRLAVVTARQVRMMSAIVYYTYVFPACSIAESLVKAGQDYAESAISKTTKKKVKTKKLPSCS